MSTPRLPVWYLCRHLSCCNTLVSSLLSQVTDHQHDTIITSTSKAKHTKAKHQDEDDGDDLITSPSSSTMHAFTIIAMLAACCGNGSAAFQPSPKIDQRCPWGAESQRRHDRIFHRNASPSEIEYSDEDPRRYGLHKLGNLLHELHPRVSASVLRLADIWVGKMIASESGDVGNDADSENERDWNNVVRALEAVQKELKAIKEANPEWKEYCEAEPGAVAMLAAIIEEVDNMISVEGCMSIGPQASLPYLDAMRDVLVLRTELAGDKDQDEDAKEAISLFIDLRDQAAAYLLDFIDWIES